MSVSPDEVKAYYDTFSRERMLNYRLQSNLRIEKAIQFFRSSITSDDIVLDIGCGIGIATEAMARRARHVIGIDISSQNIWYANETINLPNAEFHCLNIIHQLEALRPFLPSAPTVITLCDVIEHIPAQDRIALFQKIRQVCSEDARLLLTFPSEFYQDYLQAEARHELQIIDNVITPEQLSVEARTAGFSLTYFRLIDVWKQFQYAHCKFEVAADLTGRVRDAAPSYWMKAKFRRMWEIADKLLFLKGRRRRYIDAIFDSQK